MGYDRRVFLGIAAAGLAATMAGRVGPAGAQGGKMKPGATDVLLVIDVQNCFTPGGSLAVKDGDSDHSPHQPARGQLRACGAHPGLAHAGPHLLRLDP